MNRAVAACWTFVLLSAFFCETVMSQVRRGGVRGGARGGARGSGSRGSRERGRERGSSEGGSAREYGSYPARFASAAGMTAAPGTALLPFLSLFGSVGLLRYFSL
ncbi:hypothetical protein ANANG_G00304840 [Anguilla anguilla]|uniref:Shadow of prion protein n=1 Tax=Anguilla anguilla TaxID=7936 RepID=A0A9D3LK70_ANGAN|nr:hypothetical protein ANANG_G00304840 [Anguilla anguilla]